MISRVYTYDLPTPPILQKEAFLPKMREIISLNHILAKKRSKKPLQKYGLNL